MHGLVTESFLTVMSFGNIAAILGATLIGIAFGAVPGLGAVVGIALFMPFTYTWPSLTALIFMAIFYNADVYGGSFSAILINAPGTPGSAATMFDGYPMAVKGRGGVALGAAAAASFVGGCLGLILLVIFAPTLALFGTRFGPAENCLLAVFALSLIASIVRGSTVKGLISAVMGLVLAMVGYDYVVGIERFTFGLTYLQDGVPLVPAFVGLFALSQVLRLGESGESISKSPKLSGGVLEGCRSVLKYPATVIRSALIGAGMGVLPGAGGPPSTFLAYAETVRESKHPETFGKGDVEGVIAPETANNACVMGAFIPTLALGIPGTAPAALFMGVMMMHGIAPGPFVFDRSPDLIYSLFMALAVGNIVILLTGLFCARYFEKITILRNEVIVPSILFISLLGSYAVRNSIADVGLAIAFGFLGYWMTKNNYSPIPFVLGFILEPIAERGFEQAMAISDGSYSIFVSSGIAKALVAFSVLSLLYPMFVPLFRRGRDRETRQ